MADIAALAAELTNDPLVIGYAGMLDQQVLDSLSAMVRPGVFETSDAREYLLLQGRWPAIEDAVLHHADAPVRQAAWSIKIVLDRYDTINMADPMRVAAISGTLDALVAAGLIVAADKTALLALGNDKQSRTAELGLGRLTVGDIMAARA